MNKIFAWISRKNKNKIVIPLAVIAVMAYVLMGTNMFGLITDFKVGQMLDTQFVYSGSYFVNTLNSLNAEEVTSYLYTHIIDYVFIFSFYPALTFIFDSINKHHSNIVILPLVAMLFDFLENIIIDIKLLASIPQFFGSISGIFTVLKFSILIVSIILMLINIYKHRRKNAKA